MRKYIAIPLIAIYIMSSFSSFASTLSVNEPRIVLTDKNKKGEFKVYNTSNEMQSFRVTLVDKAMDTLGNIKTVETSPTSAINFLRVGPRMGKNIAPKQFQKFRIRAKMSKIPEGEFRSHLLVEPMTPPSEESAAGIHIKPNIKYSIPVIIRKGDLHAEVGIKNINTSVHESGQSIIEFDLIRTGNRSVYGDIKIYQELNQTDNLIKEVIGQAIYTDISSRKFTLLLPLKVKSGTNLKIKYVENPEFGGDAKAELSIRI